MEQGLVVETFVYRDQVTVSPGVTAPTIQYVGIGKIIGGPFIARLIESLDIPAEF